MPCGFCFCLVLQKTPHQGYWTLQVTTTYVVLVPLPTSHIPSLKNLLAFSIEKWRFRFLLVDKIWHTYVHPYRYTAGAKRGRPRGNKPPKGFLKREKSWVFSCIGVVTFLSSLTFSERVSITILALKCITFRGLQLQLLPRGSAIWTPAPWTHKVSLPI